MMYIPSLSWSVVDEGKLFVGLDMSLLEVGEIFIVSLVNTTTVVLGKTYLAV